MAHRFNIAGVALNTWRTGLNLLMPPRCVLCDAEIYEGIARQTCPLCAGQLRGDATSACRRCGMSSQSNPDGRCSDCRNRRFHFQNVVRVGEYTGPLRDAVLRAKTLAGEPVAAELGALLSEAVQQQIENNPATSQFDMVTCVPSFWWRRLQRGTNSAAVIAQVVARRLGISAGLDMLVCRRNIEKQSQLSLAERKKNVRQAFRKSWGFKIADAKLLLVDDVMTSGATANEIARVLKDAGARSVMVAVVARALGPDW